MLKIEVESDFKKNLGNYRAHVVTCLSRVYCSIYTGRIGVFFGNKSTSPLKNFSSSLTLPGDLASCLSVVAKPIATCIEVGAQVQQVIDATALNVYTEVPCLVITFK